MTRNRMIRAFVAVWCVVCLTYVGVRSAVATLVDGAAVTREDAEAVSSTVEPIGQDEHADQTEPTSQAKPTSRAEPMEQVTPDSTAQSEPVTQTEQDDSSTYPYPVTREEQTETETQELGQEEQAAVDSLSLSEYLSGFTCGSCRRNCSLDNPRCHNGSRLAQVKTEEYYSMVGE